MTISKDAFETHVLAILGPLHGVARRLTKNEADAEDLVAESVTRAWQARASLADTRAFRESGETSGGPLLTNGSVSTLSSPNWIR